jgi:hypothetical protein
MRDGFAGLERALQRPRHSGPESFVPLTRGCSARVAQFDARRFTARTPTGHVAFAPVHPAPRYSFWLIRQ